MRLPTKINMNKYFKIFVLAFSFLVTEESFCQQVKNNYTKTIYSIEGDLNRDGIPDLVIVKQDSTSKYKPHLLEIKFKKSDGQYETVFKSEKTLWEIYPDGDNITAAHLEDLQIKKGVIIFTNQYIRGNTKHKFRYQNDNFELIGYTSHGGGSGLVYIDYNLITGTKITHNNPYDNPKTGKKTTIEKISPLPKLQDFEPLSFDY